MNHFAIGVVVDNDDPDREGRVLISCPSIGPDPTWARIVRPLIAGVGVLLPENGDQVFVAFENGSVGSPYVLGSL
jgi:uncharacterized protein involved in type VI secretion and phage assembly